MLYRTHTGADAAGRAIVVLDNLRAHKSVRVRELLAGVGCELWYLPAYSPDLSPIEEAFAKLQMLLRRAGARTSEDLLRAIGLALDEISSSDACGFFTHCGYSFSPPDQSYCPPLYYHDVRMHEGLRLTLRTQAAERPRYRQRTPAQAAGLTNKHWRMNELMSLPLYGSLG